MAVGATIGWFVGSVVVVAAGCCVSREIVGTGCAAGLLGARTVGATGAAHAEVMAKEKISARIIVLICFL
ncbi:MAG: hypothetical protein IJR22_02315 [Acidaminococcaceae bacterium]|nr:hypothetical protein [Acidaminococcaceae bacterium]